MSHCFIDLVLRYPGFCNSMHPYVWLSISSMVECVIVSKEVVEIILLSTLMLAINNIPIQVKHSKCF